MKKRKVVITGMGVSSSLTDDYVKLIEYVKEGTFEGIQRDLSVSDACAEKVGKNTCRRMDDFTLYSIVSAFNAIEDSKMNLDSEDKTKIGTIYSTTWGPAYTTNKYFAPVIKDGAKAVSPILFPYTVTNASLGAVARLLGLSGVSTMLVDSSAIEFACGQIMDEKADVVICGATEFVTPLIEEFEFGDNLKVPFDGSVALVLEDKEHAIKRNAHIYTEITGGSSWMKFDSEANKQEFEQSVNRSLNNCNTADAKIMCSTSVGNALSDDDHILPMTKYDFLSLEQIISVIYSAVDGDLSEKKVIVSEVGEDCFDAVMMVNEDEV